MHARHHAPHGDGRVTFMKTLGVTLFAHNAFTYDYCLEASLESALGVADEIVLVDASSNDATSALMRDYASRYDVIKLIDAPWQPNALGAWLVDLINLASSHLTTPMHLALQADEVLHEDDYASIRSLAEARVKTAFHRLNFWHDHWHVAPPGRVCGHCVTRLAPTSASAFGDGENLDPRDSRPSPLRIFHYGFIRNTSAFIAKSRLMQNAYFATCDPIIDEVERRGAEALIDPAWPTSVTRDTLLPYTGTHPRVAHKWLTSHGFKI